jgi:hypothetical protein
MTTNTLSSVLQMPDDVAKRIDELAKAEDPIGYYRGVVQQLNLERDLTFCMRSCKQGIIST